MARFTSGLELLISGYDSPEGPAFDRYGNLFHVNWETSSIIKMTPDGASSEFHNTGGIPAGLAFHPDGSLYIADEGEHIHGVLRLTMDGQSSVVADEFDSHPLNGANDLAFGPDGTLYFSDPWGSNDKNPIGGFYRLLPTGHLDRIDSGLAFPNGVAVTTDGSAVILVETYRNRLLRYLINGDGTMGPREIWADTAPPPGGDGIAFDENGDLYVAHYNGGRVDVFDPNGKQIDQLAIPGSKPTNCAFGGPENKTLVITEVETQSLYRIQVSVPGLPLNDGRPR